MPTCVYAYHNFDQRRYSNSGETATISLTYIVKKGIIIELKVHNMIGEHYILVIEKEPFHATWECAGEAAKRSF